MILDKQVQIVRTGCIHIKIKRSTRSYTCFSHVICFHSVPSWALFLLKWMYAFSQMKYLFDGNNVKFLWKQKLVHLTAAAAAKSLQSCLTVQRHIDHNPPGSAVPGILQARPLEWVAIAFSNARKWKVKVKSLSRVRLLATPWTVAHQAPPSMGFSRQEHWSGLPLRSLFHLTRVY